MDACIACSSHLPCGGSLRSSPMVVRGTFRCQGPTLPTPTMHSHRVVLPPQSIACSRIVLHRGVYFWMPREQETFWAARAGRVCVLCWRVVPVWLVPHYGFRSSYAPSPNPKFILSFTQVYYFKIFNKSINDDLKCGAVSRVSCIDNNKDKWRVKQKNPRFLVWPKLLEILIILHYGNCGCKVWRSFKLNFIG